MATENFNVVIMHGHNQEYKKVKKLLHDLGYHPIVLMEKFTGGIILSKVKKAVWNEAHCAVIIMSPDDQLKSETYRARQNVVFELGYCMGTFDSIPKKYWYHAVIVLKEKSVEDFSDIAGLELINYTRFIDKTVLGILKEVLKKTFREAARYYDEL